MRQLTSIWCLLKWLGFRILIFFLLILLWTFSYRLSAQNVDFKGLLSSWAAVSVQKEVPSQFGLRLLPAFTLTKPFRGERFVEVEFCLNTWGIANFRNFKDFATEGQIKLYRSYGRYSSSHFELRIGLQKISFGSATLLRPLMWFDRLDPRDPLQITDGVYALLLRYYFLNNTNLWFWGLYGNKDPKGWELWPTAKRKPEFGGRVQIPLGKGELGLSVHHRQASLNESNIGLRNLTSWSFGLLRENSTGRLIPEERLGLDGKWDIGPGLWFEITFLRLKNEFLLINRQRAFTLGSDYTFSLGKGLHFLAEYFEMSSGINRWTGREKAKLIAISLSYPLNLLDHLMAIAFHDGQNGDTHLFFRWQRTYDHWNFHLMAFWNPERFRIYQSQNQIANFFAGKGLQLIVVFHY